MRILLLIFLPIVVMGARRASFCYMSYPAGCTDADTGEHFLSYGTDENGFEIEEPPPDEGWNSRVCIEGYDFRNSGIDREFQGPASRERTTTTNLTGM